VQLEGRLASFPLRELIEMVAYSSVKGMLEVRTPALAAQLYFRDGVPSHAVAGELRGIDAVGLMFEQQDGDFRFYAGSEPDDDTLWMEAPDLIARGEQLARRWAPLRPLFPSMTCVPALDARADRTKVQISEDIWPVLSVVDGKRNILAIAEMFGVECHQVCTALATLHQSGLIRITMPDDPASPQAAGAESQQGKRGFFERLIERTLEEEARNPDSRYAPPEQRYVESD
jgi:hypothetical protein